MDTANLIMLIGASVPLLDLYIPVLLKFILVTKTMQQQEWSYFYFEPTFKIYCGVIISGKQLF